jgi:hypothetical protein
MKLNWILVPFLMIILSCVPWLLRAESSVKPDSYIADQRAQDLRDEIQDLVMDHDSTLEVLEAKLSSADSIHKMAVQAESLLNERKFQQKYLTLMLDYSRLVGDSDTAEYVEKELEQLVKSGDLPPQMLKDILTKSK